jgi:peptidoglycan-associated lipoprotein
LTAELPPGGRIVVRETGGLIGSRAASAGLEVVMTNLRAILSLAPLLCVLTTGCDANKNGATPPAQPPASLAGRAPVQATAGAPIPPGAPSGEGLETPALHVSNEIAHLCNLPKQEAATNFDFDSDAIGDADRVVLSALARCLSEGALKGRGLALVGRADARGEPEYNLSLGESRAESVRRYLHDLGVQAERLRATSRGELDATGTDEAGWAHDRRVDISLAN